MSSPERITVNINGKSSNFAAGTTILAAAREMGVDLPTLCNDSRLKACGACRMCLVKVKGIKSAVASCMTALTNGMEVETHSADIEDSRTMQLKMLARTYPKAAFLDHPEKPFHKLASAYGLTEADFAGSSRVDDRDQSNPYIAIDMSRCIDCYACVRICDELQGQFVWQVAERGKQTRVAWDHGATFAESSCVSCGACVSACPTGALEDKSVLANGYAERWTRTVCPYCGSGCEVSVGTRGDRMIQSLPVEDSPASHGHLCVKGRYAFDFVHSTDRATEPMIRENGDWRVVSWPEAINYASAKMREIIAEHGAEQIAVLGSARATNEENYLAQKFTRVCLETNNVDCCARVCHTPTAAAMKMMLGTGAATNSFDDIDLTRTILICGANPTENHPVPAARMKQAVLRGANLIVIDPRKTELTKYANIHLQLKPGTNILLFNALASAIVEEHLYDESFVADRVAEFEEFRDFVSKYRPEDVSERSGVPAELIRRAARMYATQTPAMSFHGLGMTEHLQGTEGVMCVVNLALLTGNIGKRGAGVNPLRGQNNVQGSAHMGCDPGVLTGGIGLDDGREHFESVWGVPIPKAKGLNQLQMMDAAFGGKLKGMWVIGYDVFLSNANSHKTAASFKNLDLVIVQDMFLNETAREFGTVFFPAASSYEKNGTFMNAERRVSLLRKVIEPIGNSRSDWEIICDMATAMGMGGHFAFRSSEEIWDEIRQVWPNAAGITYRRLEKHGLQWNCPDEDHPGTEVLHTESFAKDKRAALRRIDHRPTKEVVSEEFPFLLTTGRALYQFNAGTMTMRTGNAELRPTDLLVMSPKDADSLALKKGDTIKLISRYGEAALPLDVNESVQQGELFATFHDPKVFLNYITSPYRDRFVQAPEYKVTAVRVEKA